MSGSTTDDEKEIVDMKATLAEMRRELDGIPEMVKELFDEMVKDTPPTLRAAALEGIHEIIRILREAADQIEVEVARYAID